MAKKTIPVNNYNDSNNYGTSGAAPSLYSDKHYLDGDGFLYGLGMASLRQIVKGKNDDIENYFWWNGGKSTTAKLGLNITAVEEAIKGTGLFISAGRLNVNVGQGLYIGTNSQHSATYDKININFFKKNVTIDGTASLYNTSGLELATGTADATGAPAAGQLRIKLSETGSGTSYINTSGLVLKDPGDIGNLHVTEGLMVNYDNVTIGLNASNQLEVKASAIVPNISGTNPIEVTTNENTKTIGLKLLAGTHQGNISGMRVVEAGTVESGDTLLGGLAVNVQSPLMIADTGSSGSAVGLNGSAFIDWLGSGSSDFGLDNTLSYYTSDGRHMIGFNRSVIGQGLNVATLEEQQYRIDIMPGDYTEIKTMGDSGNQYTAVDVDIPALFAQVTRDKSIYGIGITPNSDASHANNLYVDGSVLAGDGLQGTGYSDSDSTITPKLKLKIASGSPLYIDTNKALNLRIGDGLIITNTSTTPTLQFAMGSGFVKNGESIDLKAASTSEIGGLKVSSTPTTPTNATAVDFNLLKSSGDAGYVRGFVFNTADDSLNAQKYPYTAQYINNNYSTKTEVTAEIATAVSDISGREYKIFTSLPTKGSSQSWADFYAAYKKYIALVSNTGSEPDAYKEYILIVTNESTGECHWEQIGDTKFTTDNFVAKTDVLTQAEVASIVQDVFGF